MKLRLLVAALAVAGFLNQVPRASAEPLGSLELSFDPPPNGNGVRGGPYHWTQQPPLNSNFGTAITTYCLEFDVGIQSGSFTADTDLTLASTPANGGLDAAKITAINTLFSRYYNDSFATPETQMAFQFALWELVYDGPANANSLNTGAVRGSSPIAQAALNLLTGAYSGTADDLVNARLVVLIAPDGVANQNQITVVPNGAVPAPPALLLAGIGVLALVGRARLTRKPVATA